MYIKLFYLQLIMKISNILCNINETKFNNNESEFFYIYFFSIYVLMYNILNLSCYHIFCKILIIYINVC